VPAVVVAVTPGTTPVSAAELLKRFGVAFSVTEATVDEQLAALSKAEGAAAFGLPEAPANPRLRGAAGRRGPAGGAGLGRPVQSLVLVQGALSLWSYCEDIPYRRGRAGYFRPLIAGARVAGPIVTTRSRFDTAVGRWYPLAATAARQVDFAPGELPRYGGVGTFGLRGPGLDLLELEMKPVDGEYDFAGGRVYNPESSTVIRKMDGASGAHSDIAHPEVGHAVWAAAV
jgi:hypothetical protein